MLTKLRRAMIAGQNEGEVREERFAGKIKKLGVAQVSPKFPPISQFQLEGATGKANGLPVFLLLLVVEPRFFLFLPGCI
jgi:hypothetical protein